MQLQYLDFDFSDEDTGRGSFDAMASAPPRRLPALLAEIATVLRWSVDVFGSSEAQDTQDVAEWDHALQAVAEPDMPLNIAFDEIRGEVVLGTGGAAARTTLTFTLSGSPAFCDAFREAFEVGD
ncbi:MAG: hypothetical protein ACRYGA_08010 [Janthinobacterium lividum]